MMAVANFIGGQGQKQVGAPAPAFQTGPMQGFSPYSGLDQAGMMGGGLLSALQAANQQQQAPAPVAGQTAEALSPQGPVTSKPSVFNTDEQNAAMQPEQKPGPFANFLGGIDKGLQSPSQLLGLGLLSQLTGQHPAAGLGGLLAMGLYNRNK